MVSLREMSKLIRKLWKNRLLLVRIFKTTGVELMLHQKRMWIETGPANFDNPGDEINKLWTTSAEDRDLTQRQKNRTWKWLHPQWWRVARVALLRADAL